MRGVRIKHYIMPTCTHQLLLLLLLLLLVVVVVLLLVVVVVVLLVVVVVVIVVVSLHFTVQSSLLISLIIEGMTV